MSRFLSKNETVTDRQTDLMWTKNASLFEFPMSWVEALNIIGELNKSGLFGYYDWKLPNRKELLSLISYQTINPSLPADHLFENVFNGYYWTSTTCARLPDQAWYIHLGSARVFKGMKYGSYMVWPVRTGEKFTKQDLFMTGQKSCFGKTGKIIDCQETGQDGEKRSGSNPIENRYTKQGQTVYDSYTGLTWIQDANTCKHVMSWNSAFDLISELNRKMKHGHDDWRIPNIIELESLTDMEQHSPALPQDHFFYNIQDFYWSSTTSMYNTDYAWVLYMVDGAVGVGFKQLSEFYLWPVRGKEKMMV